MIRSPVDIGRIKADHAFSLNLIDEIPVLGCIRSGKYARHKFPGLCDQIWILGGNSAPAAVKDKCVISGKA